jgi:hypothetical protein
VPLEPITESDPGDGIEPKHHKRGWTRSQHPNLGQPSASFLRAIHQNVLANVPFRLVTKLRARSQKFRAKGSKTSLAQRDKGQARLCPCAAWHRIPLIHIKPLRASGPKRCLKIVSIWRNRRINHLEKRKVLRHFEKR